MGKSGGQLNQVRKRRQLNKMPKAINNNNNNMPMEMDEEFMDNNNMRMDNNNMRMDNNNMRMKDIDMNEMPMDDIDMNEMPMPKNNNNNNNNNNNLEKKCPPGCVPEKTNEEKGIRGIINNIKNAPEKLNKGVKKTQDDALNALGNKSNEIKNNTLSAIGDFTGNISKKMNKKVSENQPKPKLNLENNREENNQEEDITIGGGKRTMKYRRGKINARGKRRTAKGKKRNTRGKKRTAKGKGKKRNARGKKRTAKRRN